MSEQAYAGVSVQDDARRLGAYSRHQCPSTWVVRESFVVRVYTVVPVLPRHSGIVGIDWIRQQVGPLIADARRYVIPATMYQHGQ